MDGLLWLESGGLWSTSCDAMHAAVCMHAVDAPPPATCRDAGNQQPEAATAFSSMSALNLPRLAHAAAQGSTYLRSRSLSWMSASAVMWSLPLSRNVSRRSMMPFTSLMASAMRLMALTASRAIAGLMSRAYSVSSETTCGQGAWLGMGGS